MIYAVFKDGELWGAYESEWQANEFVSDNVDRTQGIVVETAQWERFKIRTYSLVEEYQPRPR